MSSNNDIGPDGVIKLYPDNPQGTQVYLKDNFDKNIFNISFGGGSHLPFTQKKEGNLTFFNTTGSKLNYNSGGSGRSVRFDTYPGGGMWANKTSYSWKNNPGYLYNEKGIKNGEYTIFIRVHKALGTHQAYAAKIGGRDEDALRSLAEMVYPTATHSTVQFNYNYAHFPYVHTTPKLFGNPPSLVPEKWTGIKVIHIVASDNKSTHWEMWYNGNPFDSNGNIVNAGWEKIAEYEDRGCKQYGNVPVTWKCHKDVCRVDGFESVDIALASDREILPTGGVPNPNPGNKIDDGFNQLQGQTDPVVITDPLLSVEEAQQQNKN